MYSPEEKPLPRWVLIPVGIVFLLISIISIVVSVALIFAPNVPPTILTVALGCLFFVGSLWALYLSLRLVFINPKNNKFVSPAGLKIFALFSYLFSYSSSTRSLMGIAKLREKKKINFKRNRTASLPSNKLDLVKGMLLLLFCSYFLFDALNTNTTTFGRRTVYLSTDPIQYFLSVGFLMSGFAGSIIWIVASFKNKL